MKRIIMQVLKLCKIWPGSQRHINVPMCNDSLETAYKHIWEKESKIKKKPRVELVKKLHSANYIDLKPPSHRAVCQAHTQDISLWEGC
jgi:hypothetical protein